MSLSFNEEPAAWLGLIQSGIALAVGFGLNLTPQQGALIMAFTSAALAVFLRSKVSPATSTPPAAATPK